MSDNKIWNEMKMKETLRQKALRFIFSTIQFLFGLAVLFFLFGMVVTLFYWVVGGFQEASLLQASLLFLGVCVGSAVVVAIIGKGLEQLGLKREKHPISSKDYKLFGFTLLAMVGLVTITHIISQYFAQFPKYVSVSLQLEILKTIIQANGFLIGFSGIVFGQMFWAINHQYNTIQISILRNTNADQAPEDIRRDYLNVLDRKRRSMTLVMSLVIGLFLLSIAFSLSAMARTEIYETGLAPTIPEIANPVIFMVGGIAFFVFSIATSKMSLEEEVRRIRERRA